MQGQLIEDDDITVAKLERELASLQKVFDDAMAVASEDTFEEVVIAKREAGLDGCAALSAARLANPDAFKRYQSQGGRPVQDRVAPPPPSAFELAAQEIAKSRKLPMHVAMQKARVEFPQEFNAYQRRS